MKLFSMLFAGVGVGIGISEAYKRRKQRAEREVLHTPYGPYEAVFKRPLDILFSSIAFVILSPVMVLIAGLVRMKLGRPILFTQKRPGLKGKLFTIYKFRTMTDERDAEGGILPDRERMTEFGEMLRSTSLDELPELINIIKGDMSLVGPRPLLVEYLERYNKRQSLRHEVRPGLTGYAQVCGRNKLSWDERLEDDVRYVERITFLGDLRILLQTIRIVIKKEGISSASSVTMEPFTGTLRKGK